MKLLASVWQQRNYRIALIVAILALAWLLSGVLGEKKTTPGEAGRASLSNGAVSDFRVQARNMVAQPYQSRTLVNGHIEPNRSVELRAELDGVVVELAAREGASVSEGDVLCRIKAEDRPERLAQAEASLRKAELDYAAAERLRKKSLQSKTEMAQRKVNLANARAEFKRASLAMENLAVRAPFDGVVNRYAVEVGDLVRRGEACATILDLNPVLMVGEVAEAEVAALVSGGAASAKLQSGELVQGELRYISQQADAVTRAYRVEVAIDNSDGHLRAGLSGRLALPTGEVLAHRINQSLLTLDDRGELGVRLLDEERRVYFANVELVGDGAEGVWVTGLPARATLITVGQEYVAPGEVVSAEIVDGGPDLPLLSDGVVAPEPNLAGAMDSALPEPDSDAVLLPSGSDDE